MGVTLHVDAPRWRAHLAATLQRDPGLVPVIKGNGYGFGLARLAAEAQRLGVDTVAVGVPREVEEVRGYFAGDIVVMEPWHPAFSAPVAASDPRVVRTLSSPEAVAAFRGTNYRVVLELRTAMRRHGLAAPEDTTGVRSLGWALHLPLVGDRAAEARRVLTVAGVRQGTVWISHLAGDALTAVAEEFPGVRLRPRIGTQLWLGDRASVEARATVLDVHRVTRGDRAGYRQNRVLRNGYLLVVSGGTAHGVGLEAPKPVAGAVPRGKVLARGALAAGGFTLSPFTVEGRQRWFAEPPHMQVSLIVLPQDVTPPRIGDEVALEVRMTTASFDQVRGF